MESNFQLGRGLDSSNGTHSVEGNSSMLCSIGFKELHLKQGGA